MSKIPHYLKSRIPETGTAQDELLLTLCEVVEDQNAILDDPIHQELKRIADALEALAEWHVPTFQPPKGE